MRPGTKHVLTAAERRGRRSVFLLVGCRQLGMPVSDLLATGAPDMQLVDEQEASAIDTASA